MTLTASSECRRSAGNALAAHLVWGGAAPWRLLYGVKTWMWKPVSRVHTRLHQNTYCSRASAAFHSKSETYNSHLGGCYYFPCLPVAHPGRFSSSNIKVAHAAARASPRAGEYCGALHLCVPRFVQVGVIRECAPLDVGVFSADIAFRWCIFSNTFASIWITTGALSQI